MGAFRLEDRFSPSVSVQNGTYPTYSEGHAVFSRSVPSLEFDPGL